MMRFVSRVLSLAVLCTVPLAAVNAATGTFEAKGKVAFNGASGGVYGGVHVGDAVTLLLHVTVPGVPAAPGQYENYAIDVSTSGFIVGSVIQTFKPGPSLGLQNNYPVADGVHLFTAPLTTTGSMEFELFDGTGGNVFSSTDFESEAGTYLPGLFQQIDWNLFTPQGQIGIALDEFTIFPIAFSDLGHGLPGYHGLTPKLEGAGTLVAGTPTSLTLSDARPFSTAFFVVGVAQINAPFYGGLFVPSPDIVLAIPTGASGGFTLGTNWPAGVPSGFAAYYQTWIVDPAAVKGYAASNGLKSTAP